MTTQEAKRILTFAAARRLVELNALLRNPDKRMRPGPASRPAFQREFNVLLNEQAPQIAALLVELDLEGREGR